MSAGRSGRPLEKILNRLDWAKIDLDLDEDSA